MKINTITCHDVYNVGASLQAYALETYLRQCGHEVRIIDYKPAYLSGHYRLWGLNNTKYNRPFLREAYCLAKLPKRLTKRFGKRKKEFDNFTKQYLVLTERTYRSNEELKSDVPIADVYFAGSDQIWNTFFQNGKDPAFYLDFAPESSIKASYAASFATEDIADEWKPQIKKWLSGLNFVSVRESSGIKIAKELGVSNPVQVVDPVFLLKKDAWASVEKELNIDEPYVLIYDFDNNAEMNKFAQDLANKNGYKLFSFLKNDSCDRCFKDEGPLAFLWLVHHAAFVVSNSFHATAFSLIFQKEFAVFDRKEAINTRMRDLLYGLDLETRICDDSSIKKMRDIDYQSVEEMLDKQISESKQFIDKVCFDREENQK